MLTHRRAACHRPYRPAPTFPGRPAEGREGGLASSPRAGVTAREITMAAISAPPVPAERQPLLSIQGLAARFGPLRALDHVDLCLRPASWWRWPVRTGRARPRSSAASRVTWHPTPGRSCWRAGRCPPTRRRSCGAGSQWSGRTWRCATTWTSPPKCCSGANGAGSCFPTRGSGPRRPASCAPWGSRCPTRRAASTPSPAASASCWRWRGR
jgi:hypothetical protein